MPKVVIARQEELLDRRCNELAGIIAGEMRRNNINTETLALRSKITRKTMYNRLAHPEMFRLDELYRTLDSVGVKIILRRKELVDE